MTKDTVNLFVFVASIAAGVGLILAGYPAAGAPLLAFAIGHAGPSPFTKKETPDADQDP